jgi:hypothetical protein
MAFNDRLKPVLVPLKKVAQVISPTGVGVLLSVAAHSALWAFSPQTNFSFAAISEAAQKAQAEESIVPLVQLTPAERNRLPSFAQPRLAPNPTGLSSLQLPPGLPYVPNNNVLRRRTTIPANPIPSTVTKAPSATTTPSRRINGINITVPPRIPTSTQQPATPPRNNTVAVLPPSRVTPQLPADPNTPALPEDGQIPAVDPAPQVSLESALEGTEAAGIDGTNEGGQSETPETANTGENAVPVEVDNPEDIALAPAQGGADALRAGYEYDDTLIADAAVETATEEWLITSASGKENVASETAEISIDSGFKSCRENPPVKGRLGVLVNPDGSREEAVVLRSTGYNVLNRAALSQLESTDLAQPEVPTQYQVEVNVAYNADDCAGNSPEAPAQEVPEIFPTE